MKTSGRWKPSVTRPFGVRTSRKADRLFKKSENPSSKDDEKIVIQT